MMCIEGSPHSAGGLLACCKQEEAGAPTVNVVLLADNKRSSQWNSVISGCTPLFRHVTTSRAKWTPSRIVREL